MCEFRYSEFKVHLKHKHRLSNYRVFLSIVNNTNIIRVGLEGGSLEYLPCVKMQLYNVHLCVLFCSITIHLLVFI